MKTLKYLLFASLFLANSLSAQDSSSRNQKPMEEKHIQKHKLLISIGGGINAQTDSGLTYNTDELKISTFRKYHVKDPETKSIITTYDTMYYDDINKIKFVNDSVLTASNSSNQKFDINIYDIGSVSFKKGSHFWKGLGIGAASGLAAGFLIAILTQKEGAWQDWGSRFAVAAPIGIVLGGVIGAIIGGKTSYDEHDIYVIRQERKKSELIKLMSKYHNSGK